MPAARTEPRFIEIKPEPRRKVRLRATFIGILPQRGGGRVPFTEAELTAMRGGLTAEELAPEDNPGAAARIVVDKYFADWSV